jgi:3-oxoacyl-[acyl-carrier-protein] synthase-3
MSTVAPLPVPEIRIRRRRKRARLIRRATILGTGACVPQRVIDNEYFSRELGIDTTPEWIENRIGIHTRYWSVGESSTDLAVGAAQVALEQAGVAAKDIDAVIVATSTPDFAMPSTACLVQGRIGAQRALAFDIVNACSGFVYAVDAASRYLQGGDLKTVLVIGVDRGSRLIDPSDRRTSVFFGDGAGAAVISRRGAGRVLASKMCSRGTSEPLSVPVGGAMTMDGKAIWNFATDVLPATVRELCAAAKVSVDEIKLLVPHQANRNILAESAAILGLPIDRVAINIERYGNTLAGKHPDRAARSAGGRRCSNGRQGRARRLRRRFGVGRLAHTNLRLGGDEHGFQHCDFTRWGFPSAERVSRTIRSECRDIQVRGCRAAQGVSHLRTHSGVARA